MSSITCRALLRRIKSIRLAWRDFDSDLELSKRSGDFLEIGIFCEDIKSNVNALSLSAETFENGSVRRKFELVDRGHEATASIRRRKILANGEVVQVGDKFKLMKRGGMLRDEVLDTGAFELVGFVCDKGGSHRREALLKVKNGRVIFVHDGLFGDVYKKI